MYKEVKWAEFNHLLWLLRSHSRIMYMNFFKKRLDANLEFYVDGQNG